MNPIVGFTASTVTRLKKGHRASRARRGVVEESADPGQVNVSERVTSAVDTGSVNRDDSTRHFLFRDRFFPHFGLPYIRQCVIQTGLVLGCVRHPNSSPDPRWQN